ncbi:ATP-grasp domain-containing protein [Streptomyces sp. 7N604]|uniref:ATP-grasp domain-containing protein n=1 Tax=Streptomyces sp. 7N604 TaxID=3457415 RepID=UPI003FCFE13F
MNARSGMRPRRILVVYDYGSATPKRMSGAARDSGWELVFVLADSDHARSMKRTLGLLGVVVDSVGRAFDDVVAEVRELGPTGIVTFSEYQLAFTARIADALGLEYQSPEDVHALTDKAAQRERLRAAGVEDVRHAVVRDDADVDAALSVVGLPAIVKPLVGASSRNTSVVPTREEAHRLVAGLLSEAPPVGGVGESAVILEEYFIGRPTAQPWADYMAVEVVAFDGSVVPMFAMSKFAFAPPFRERGGYGPRSVEHPDVIKAVCDKGCRAVAALGMRRGIAEAEIKITEQGPRVIEVNGRLGGWVDDLANRTGLADPVRIALGCAMGEEPALSTPDSDAIAFQYLLHAPLAATRVTSIHGVRRLRQIPRADRVFIRVREGWPVDWRKGSASSVGAVWGRADSLSELATTIGEIENTDWISYETR